MNVEDLSLSRCSFLQELFLSYEMYRLIIQSTQANHFTSASHGQTVKQFTFLQVLQLEDAKAKARRLSNEGVMLAESERWWAAIGRWNAALALTPDDYALHEMLAQAYMQVWLDYFLLLFVSNWYQC